MFSRQNETINYNLFDYFFPFHFPRRKFIHFSSCFALPSSSRWTFRRCGHSGISLFQHSNHFPHQQLHNLTYFSSPRVCVSVYCGVLHAQYIIGKLMYRYGLITVTKATKIRICCPRFLFIAFLSRAPSLSHTVSLSSFFLSYKLRSTRYDDAMQNHTTQSHDCFESRNFFLSALAAQQ